jgi:PAS domain S-box-containing protein
MIRTEPPARLGPLHLLLVEDSESDARLIEREIRRGGYDVDVTRVTTAEEMLACLHADSWDVVISDYNLPGSSLEETLAAFNAEGHDIPFLLVSGTIGDEAAVAALKAGADDYLLKDRLARLVPTIERELEEARLREAVRAADLELDLARQRLLDETTSRARVFEALHNVAVGVAGVVDIAKVAEVTVDQAKSLVGADAVILRWYDEENQMLHLLAATGAEAWDLRPEVTAEDMGRGFLHGEATLYDRYQGHPLAELPAVGPDVSAVAVVPLRIHDRPAGALEVARNGDGFSPADLEILGLLGAQLAPALEAGRLQRALQASELRFKTAFENSPTGLAISGAEGRYLAVSQVLCDMLGYSEAELLHLDYFTITHPDDRPIGRERARQLDEGELNGYRVTKRYLHRDGRTVWVDLSVAAVRDETGAVVQLISQAQDITAQKLAQDELAESLSLLEDAQEIGDIGTFVSWRSPEKLGQDEWSKACLRIYGCDELTFDGSSDSYWRRVHPDDLARVQAAHLLADEAGAIYDLRHRIIRPDGEVRWIHERARIERDPAGSPIRYVGVTRDVTDETVAADALRASEARNAAVIEAALDSLIVADANGLVTGFNPAAERLFGYRSAEALGRDLHSLIVPERFQAAHRAVLRRNLDKGDRSYLDRRLEVILRRADGSEFPAEASTSRFEVEGSPNFSTSIRDLSDRDQVIASAERLAEVVDNTPVMLFAYDAGGVVTLAAGRATLRLLGVEPAVAIGLNAFDLVADNPEALDHLKRGLAGETFDGVIELPALGIWVESRYSPILDPEGRVIGMSGMATDVSDRVKGNQAREESDAKSRLVAVVNHEVRTPLNSILGFTELLLNERAGPLTDKQRRYASNVDAAGRHLLALVNDSLDLSRIAAGRMDMEIFELELAPILDQAAGQVQPLVDSRGLEIRVDAGGRPWVRADRRRLLQVLWNLLSNAIRHTPTGGVITISAKVCEETVEIMVKDTGIGIPADQLERIFEEYAQVEGEGEGTGLGLPVSRRLAKLMDGDIQVASEVGVGSTFTITLPRGHTSTR